MAVPKKKVSKSRTRSRRAHQHVSAPSLNKCKNCGEKKLSHNVCANCGFYKGKKVLESKEEI